MYTVNFNVKITGCFMQSVLFYLAIYNKFIFKNAYSIMIYYENNMLKLIFQKNYRK